MWRGLLLGGMGRQVIDWQEFWNDYPARLAEHDFLAQVCHTDQGRAYAPEVFDAMVDGIAQSLDLAPHHSLFDICCGNGVVTRRLAARCARAVGLDFSRPLIELARQHHAIATLDYRLGDALDLAAMDLGGPFDRICLYGALQHFDDSGIDRLFAGIVHHATRDAVVLIGAVPDAARKHLFLNTPEKQAQHLRYQREGRDRMGTWWDRATLATAAARAGLTCHFDDESPGRPGGHYRFDLRLTWLPE